MKKILMSLAVIATIAIGCKNNAPPRALKPMLPTVPNRYEVNYDLLVWIVDSLQMGANINFYSKDTLHIAFRNPDDVNSYGANDGNLVPINDTFNIVITPTTRGRFDHWDNQNPDVAFFRFEYQSLNIVIPYKYNTMGDNYFVDGVDVKGRVIVNGEFKRAGKPIYFVFNNGENKIPIGVIVSPKKKEVSREANGTRVFDRNLDSD